MATKQAQTIAIVFIRALYVAHQFAIALERRTRRALRSAYRAANICSGCESPIWKCGPELWGRGKMCCANCSHVNPNGQHVYG